MASFGDDIDAKLTVTVLGSENVGKTSIISRFFNEKLTFDQMSTFECIHQMTCEYGGKTFTIDVVDIPSSPDFLNLRNLAISNSDGFVLVYSVEDEQTFMDLQNFREQIGQLKGYNCPTIVVGNKADFEEENRQIDKITKECIACLDWEHGYTEVSAKKNLNISTVFEELIRQYLMKYHVSNDIQRRPITDKKKKSLLKKKFLNLKSAVVFSAPF